MGVLCLDAGEKCSKNFEGIYTKVKAAVQSLVKFQKAQTMINIGTMIGDNAPLCPPQGGDSAGAGGTGGTQ